MTAYLVSICKVTDFTENLKKYVEISADLVKQYGGRYIIRGEAVRILEGDYLQGRPVVIAEFPSVEKIIEFQESDYYRNEVYPLRQGTGIYDIGVYEQGS